MDAITKNTQISPTRIKAIQTKIWQWYKHHKRSLLPWRLTKDPWAILVSEIMLQQTQVDRVIPKYTTFLQTFPSVYALADASPAEVLRLWSGLGYNSRALRLQSCAKILISDFASEVPTTYEALRKLPGIGDYTARAVLAFAFNKPVAVVDTNIRRIIIAETGIPESSTPEELLCVTEQLLPKGKACEWYSALMDYGALHFTARKSGIAPVSKQSSFKGSTRFYRGKIIKLLLEHQSLSSKQLSEKLAISSTTLKPILTDLESGRLICMKKGKVTLPE